MSKLIPNVATWAGALFHHLVGTTDASGFIGVNKIAFGADGATPVDVSAATPFPVGGTFFPADATSTGNLLALGTLNAAYTITLANGAAVTGIVVTGLSGFGATIAIEASDDGGTTWATVNGVLPVSGALITTLTADAQFRVNASGRTRIRLRVSVASGSVVNATIASIVSTASGLVGLSSPIPAGSALVGATAGSLGVALAQAQPAGGVAGLVITGGGPDGVAPVSYAHTAAGLDRSTGFKQSVAVDAGGRAIASALSDPTVLYASISVTAAGSNAIVAIVAGKRIKVMGYFLICGATANTLTWLDGTTAITGAMPFLANQGLQASPTPFGEFQTSVGAALNLNLSGATPVTGHITYVAY
jgi:hypothetical protein